VTAVLPRLAPARVVEGPFEIGCVSEDGAELRLPLEEAWSFVFERGRPVRRFTARRGQRHLSGLWWSATTGAHVGFESWLERDHVVALDFDRSVIGIASQPFWLYWTDDEGRRVSHAPDYFARRADGSAVVVDCRPVDRRPSDDVVKFDATAAACASLGWEYRLVGGLDQIRLANLRWLAGYRHPRYRLDGPADGLADVFRVSTPLMAGAEIVGDPVAVLPVLFHLLWCQDLSVELSVPLHAGSCVRVAEVAS
jgi:hypothetical protein